MPYTTHVPPSTAGSDPPVDEGATRGRNRRQQKAGRLEVGIELIPTRRSITTSFITGLGPVGTASRDDSFRRYGFLNTSTDMGSICLVRFSAAEMDGYGLIPILQSVATHLKCQPRLHGHHTMRAIYRAETT